MTRAIDQSLHLAGLPPLGRSAWVEVDVDVLTSNASALCSLAAPADLAPVVKADGYGHGLEMAARCAVAGGARWLCVADSGEAIRLREDGYEGRILVLYPVPAEMYGPMAQLGVDLTLGSVDDARGLGALSVPDDVTIPVHLEIDTGMTRGGVAPEDVVAVATVVARAPSTTLAGAWTHLAAPEDPDMTAGQLDRFDHALAGLARAGVEPGTVHVSASGGLLTVGPRGRGLVRPGIAFYGLHPGAGDPLPGIVRPALAVRAHPVRIAEVPEGVTVGYGGDWSTERASLIATLPIGYADGWSRSSSPGSWVLVEGERAPVVGRISSDSLTVDVTGITGVGADSEFTLLGRSGGAEVTADEVAMTRGTISWEVLQQLGGRLGRVYTSGSVPIAVRPESKSALVAAGSTIPYYR